MFEITKAIRDEIRDLETRFPQYRVCAVAFDATTGDVFDLIYSWETAQTMASDTDLCIIAIKSDRHKSKRDIQAMVDYERAIAIDCFA